MTRQQAEIVVALAEARFTGEKAILAIGEMVKRGETDGPRKVDIYTKADAPSGAWGFYFTDAVESVIAEARQTLKEGR